MKLKLRKDMNLVLEKVWTVKGWDHFRRTALNSIVDIFAVRWNVRWGIWLVCGAVTHQVGNLLECFLFAPMAQLCLLVTPKLVWEDVDSAWQLISRPAPTSYKAWATRHIYINRYILYVYMLFIYYIFWIYTSIRALTCMHAPWANLCACRCQICPYQTQKSRSHGVFCLVSLAAASWQWIQLM